MEDEFVWLRTQDALDVVDVHVHHQEVAVALVALAVDQGKMYLIFLKNF